MTSKTTKPKVATGQPTPDLNIKSFPPKEVVENYIGSATGAAAVASHIQISEFTGGRVEENDLENDEKNRRSIIIDTEANIEFESVLETAPFISHGIDAEGGKEKHPEKLGVSMPLAIGTYGAGEKRISFVVDVVEGTTAASHGRPNAISIVGVSSEGGITKIPYLTDGEEVVYFRKLFAPAAFRDVLNIEKPARENLEAMMRKVQIPASAITVAVMNRVCNTTIIRQAQELGANVELISTGDLMWGLRAIHSDLQKPIIMLGRGGAQEGSIAAVGAKALGATGQLRVVEEAKDLEVVDRGQMWTANEFVTGERDHSMVIFSAITQNTHYDLQPVQKIDHDLQLFNVDTMVIDSKGFRKLPNSVSLKMRS